MLRPTAGGWDSRGTRVTAVVDLDPLTVLYDGRARAEDNWFETTGVATWDGTVLTRAAQPPIASPHAAIAGLAARGVCRQTSITNWYESLAFCRSPKPSAIRPCSSRPRNAKRTRPKNAG